MTYRVMRYKSRGQVYCTTRDLYQSSMELGTITADIHGMLNGEEDGLVYLYRLK